MRARTDITRKERSTLTLSDFKGVDLSSPPTAIQSNRATMMRNFINEYDQNKKRNGWRETVSSIGNGQINGIFEYKYKDHHVLLVHVGTEMYEIKTIDNDLDSSFSLLCEGLLDQKSQAFYNNGRLYIVGCGDYYVYGTWDDGISYRMQCVLDAPDDIYVPTTTISINDTTCTEDKRATLDQVNLLTPKRKNKLVGTATAWEICDGGNYYATRWFLDSSIDNMSYVHLKIETIDDSGKNIVVELDNFNPNTRKNTTEFRCTSITSGGTLYLLSPSPSEASKVEIGLPCGEFYTIGDKSQIRIRFRTTPVIPERDNIIVTFKHSPNKNAYEKDRILNSQFGSLFGTLGNSDRLFLSGNPDYPNMIFYSKDNDFTYFGDTSYAVLGSSETAVKGFGRLSDSTLAIYKEETSREATVHFCQGTIEKKTDPDTKKEYYDEVFRVHSGAMGEGLLSTYTTANFAGDSLLLSRNGLFGIVLSDNVATTERYARERSRLINAKLTQHDLSNACGIVYKNRYYLSVDGVCYVADARHKTTVNDDIDGSYNYEWWYWDNIPARVWAVIGGKLYFGTADGRICVFDDEYADRTYTISSGGQLSLSVSQNHITHDRSIVLEEGARVTFENRLYAVVENSAVLTDGRIQSSQNDIYRFHEGMEVYATNVGNSGLSEDVCYTVTDIEYDTCTYKISEITLKSGGFKLLRKLTDKPLYLVNVTDTTFQLREYKEGDIIVLSDYKLSTSLIGRFEHRKNVVAEWYSPMLDLGTASASKTLLGFTLCAESTPGGALSFGYDTRRTDKLYDAKGINRFSLDELTFNDITFDTGFATSYSKKVFERNFNFIRFRFISDNDKNCALNSLSATYKINKQNKGVR